MKIGPRVPSLRRRIAAGLSLRRQLVSRLGLRVPRGWGWLRSPHRAAYNWLYRRTTFGVGGALCWLIALMLVVLSDVPRRAG
jgi:hypothetical protein